MASTNANGVARAIDGDGDATRPPILVGMIGTRVGCGAAGTAHLDDAAIRFSITWVDSNRLKQPA